MAHLIVAHNKVRVNCKLLDVLSNVRADNNMYKKDHFLSHVLTAKVMVYYPTRIEADSGNSKPIH